MTEAMKNDRDHDEGPGTQPAGFAELADLSDPLLDVLAQRHLDRDRPLFAS